jgi:hypothetical protein
MYKVRGGHKAGVDNREGENLFGRLVCNMPLISVHSDRILTASGFSATNFETLPAGWIIGKGCILLGERQAAIATVGATKRSEEENVGRRRVRGRLRLQRA